MIVLTPEERDRFAAYLEQDLASKEMMLEQLKKIGPQAMEKHYSAEIMASKIVCQMLRNTETETL